MSNLNEHALNRNLTFSRNILRNVYVWMTIALAITAAVAYGIGQNTAMVTALFMQSPFTIWGILILQLVMVLVLSRFVLRMSPLMATLLFAAYSVLTGVSLSFIFVAYELGSIFKAFAVTAGLFGAMSIYAVSTKRDLSGLGHFLMMGVVGLIIASVVNMFLQSGPMDFIISVVGVLIFTGLTAYDTQKIKNMSDSYGESVNEGDYIRLSIVGALTLYLDFINMFIYLVRIFGNRD